MRKSRFSDQQIALALEQVAHEMTAGLAEELFDRVAQTSFRWADALASPLADLRQEARGRSEAAHHGRHASQQDRRPLVASATGGPRLRGAQPSRTSLGYVSGSEGKNPGQRPKAVGSFGF